MACHSSALAWKIPWAEEPGGPQPVGLQSWRRLLTLSPRRIEGRQENLFPPAVATSVVSFASPLLLIRKM